MSAVVTLEEEEAQPLVQLPVTDLQPADADDTQAVTARTLDGGWVYLGYYGCLLTVGTGDTVEAAHQDALGPEPWFRDYVVGGDPRRIEASEACRLAGLKLVP